MTGYFIVGRKIIMRSFKKKKHHTFFLKSHGLTQLLQVFFLLKAIIIFLRFIDIFTGIIVFFKTLFYDFF